MAGRPATLRINVTSDSQQARGDMRTLGPDVSSAMGKVKQAGVAAAALAAAAIGAAVVGAYAKALEQGKSTSRLAAQLGATPEQARQYGKVAGQLYSSGVAEEFTDATNAIKSVMQQGIAPPNATNDQLKSISARALDIANIMDADVTESVRAASTMIKTGLAKNADEAFDILAKGAQQGADKGQDLLDTFTEYPVQFQKLGLSGQEAMGLVNQGLKGGAFNADKAADALKEFSIRAVDGSKSTAEGFRALGLSSDDMTGRIARGGASARDGLKLVLDQLRGIKDPAEQSRIAVQLFGTQSEDMGRALMSMDLSTAVTQLGNVEGAAAQVGTTLGDNASSKITVFWRTAQQYLVDFLGGTVIPALGQAKDFVQTEFGPAFSSAGAFIQDDLVPAFREAYVWVDDNILPLYKRFAETILPHLENAFTDVRDAVDRNSDEFAQLKGIGSDVVELLGGQQGVARKAELAGYAFEGSAKLIGVFVDSVGRSIDNLRTLVDWLKTAKSWLEKLPDIPGVTSGGILGKLSRSSSFTLAPGDIPAARAGADAPPVLRARVAAPVVNISIDGAQLQGRITRTVRAAMDADGARLAAGGWA